MSAKQPVCPHLRRLVLLSGAAWLAAAPLQARDLRVPLPERNDLVLHLPESWQSQVRGRDGKQPPVVAISGGDPRTFQMLLTPSWTPRGAKPPTTAEVRRIAQAAADQLKPRMVESEIALKDLAAPGKSGFYFAATFKQPEAGGFRHLTQGAIGFEDLRITFSIFATDATQGLVPRALDVLRNLER